MYVTLHRIRRLTFDKVSFYTVQVENKDYEFENFQKRLGVLKRSRPLLAQMFQFIEDVGNDYGAKEHLFKEFNDRGCFNLTEEEKSGFKVHYIEAGTGKTNLILYCLRLSDSAVILLNGDMKTSGNLEKCVSRPHYELARNLSRNLASVFREIGEVNTLDALDRQSNEFPLRLI